MGGAAEAPLAGGASLRPQINQPSREEYLRCSQISDIWGRLVSFCPISSTEERKDQSYFSLLQAASLFAAREWDPNP